MPKYRNAADVRAAHPGAYDDLTDDQINQKLAAQQASTGEDLAPGSLGAMHHPGLGDDYTSAVEGELLRTGKEAAIGLARSPLDLVKGTVNAVAHPLDTMMGIGHTLLHPVDSAMELAKNPREAGSALGQLLLAPKVPGAANTALAEGPTLVGRGLSAVGRGAEALGTSKLAKAAGKFGVMESALRMDPKGMALAAAPTVLEHGGKLLQRGGAALEGLDLSLGRGGSAAELIPESRRLNPARVSTQTRDFGQEMDSAAGSWERSPSSDPMVPGRRNPSIQGLEEAAPNKWANDESARQPKVVDREASPERTAVLQDRVRRRMAGESWDSIEKDSVLNPPKSPIEKFYESDPQARGVGGEVAEGRTTGKFPEGKFGLNNLDANVPYETPGSNGFHNNEFGPDETFRDLGTEDEFANRTNTAQPPVAVDSLADLSARMGKQMSPEEASMLFNRRFGLKQPTLAETQFGGR